VGWLDVLVAVLLAGFGVALAVVLLIGGVSLLQAALAFLLFAAAALRWSRTSFTGETLRNWRNRRAGSDRD
jgi:hypothetical protein